MQTDICVQQNGYYKQYSVMATDSTVNKQEYSQKKSITKNYWKIKLRGITFGLCSVGER